MLCRYFTDNSIRNLRNFIEKLKIILGVALKLKNKYEKIQNQ